MFCRIRQKHYKKEKYGDDYENEKKSKTVEKIKMKKEKKEGKEKKEKKRRVDECVCECKGKRKFE